MNKEEIVITPKRKLLDLQLNRVLKYKNLLFMLVKRDFIVYYKQTILGPLWYLIQPIFSTIMYMIVFGTLAKIGTDSIPQPLFYFSGTMLWTFFMDNIQKTSRVFLNNKDLFGKVYFPRVVVPISNIIGNMIKLVIQFSLFIIIYFYYLINKEIVFSGVKLVLFVVSLIWIAMIAVGFGMIISSITTKYRDIAMALDFILSLLMYATPIVYPISELSGRLEMLICFNPISAPVELFRYAFFGISSIPIWSMVYSSVVTIFVVFFGLVIFNQNEQKFIDVI